MLKDGWIKIYRKLLESDIFYGKPSEWLKIWIYILLEVNHQNTNQLERGVGFFSWRRERNYLKRITEHQWHNCIRWLKKQGMIETQKTTRGIIIKVLNYKEYQGSQDKFERSSTCVPKQATQKTKQKTTQIKTDKSIPEPITDKLIKKQNKTKNNTKNEIKTKQKQNRNNTIMKECKNVRNKNIYKELFDFWNSLKIVIHQKLTEKMKKAINARLKDGKSPEQIKEAMSNYAKILHSDKYYWSHKWTLNEFLSREEGAKMELFLTKNDPFSTYKKRIKKEPIPAYHRRINDE